MKKLLFTLILCYGISPLYSQFHKGNFKAGIGLTTVEEYPMHFPKSITKYPWGDQKPIFVVQGGIGVFLSNKLEAGIEAGYYNTLYGSANSPANIETKAFLYGVFVTRYFPVNENFAIQLSFYTNTGNIEKTFNLSIRPDGSWSENGDKFEGKEYHIGLTPGIAYSPVKFLMITANFADLGYSISKFKWEHSDNETTTNIFDFQVDLSTINLGFYFIF